MEANLKSDKTLIMIFNYNCDTAVGAVVAHVGAVVAHVGAVVALVGAVVAHCGSSSGSLVATPDCKLQSWVQIQQSPQPTVDCQSLDGLPSRMALCCTLSSEGQQRSIYKKTPKTIKEKKKL